MKEYVVSQPVVLDESLQTERLVVEAAGKIVAPDGKNVTLTVDGIQKNIVPGVYCGDVRLTVTDGFGRAGGFGPPVVGTDFTAAIRCEDGQLIKERSVLAAVQGGTCEDGIIRDVTIVSQGNEFSGIDLENGSYVLEDISMSMNGYGGSDFTGQGIALAIGGNSKVTADRITIHNRGVIRGGVMVTDDADVVIRNSEIETLGGTDQEYAATTKVKKGMLNVPWQLGLTGNCRASNVLGRGSVRYENCKVSSWGWGVLSADATDPVDRWGDYSVHMTAKDSEITLLGSSGYTAFTIGACLDTFENSTIRAASYALIQADENASAEYDNCRVYSRRFGTMSYANQGGHIKIKDSAFETENAVFLIKGCYPQISVSNSTLTSHDGVILQIIDCDDPTYSPTGKHLDSAPPEKIPEHDVTRVNTGNFHLFNKLYVEDKPTDVQAHFSDMTLTGDFYNGIANRCPVGNYDPSGKKPFEMDAAPAPELAGGFGAAPMPAGMPNDFPPMGEGFPPMGAMPEGFLPMSEGFPPMGAMPEGFLPMSEGFPPMGEGFPPMGENKGSGDPDPGMSEMSFVKSPSTNMPINLAVTMERVQYTGKVTAVASKHAISVADRVHYDQLGKVTNTPCPVVNNGVILTLGSGSAWTVTGDCYLSALHIAADAVVKGAENRLVSMTVNGVETAVIPGDYTGDIRIGIL